MSPASQGGVLTTGPPGESSISVPLLTVLWVSGPSQAALVIHGWYWVEPPTQRLDWERPAKRFALRLVASVLPWLPGLPPSRAVWGKSDFLWAETSSWREELHSDQGLQPHPCRRELLGAVRVQPDSRCGAEPPYCGFNAFVCGAGGGLGSVSAGLRLGLPEGQLPISRRAVSPKLLGDI